MNNISQPDSKNKRVSRILGEIEEKSDSFRSCIFRGESQRFPKVCSNLYRICADHEMREPVVALKTIEKIIVETAKEYIDENETNDFKIFAEIQHYGGKTNLIDFTKDYHVALIFACIQSLDKEGRVILMEEADTEHYEIKEAPQMINRAAHQRSVFVESTKGFIDPEHYKEVCIPKDLKQDVLIHLRRRHGKSAKSVYDDIYRITQSLEWDRLAYLNWLKGEEFQEMRAYGEAIDAYTQAIKQKIDFLEVYMSRGWTYYLREEYNQSAEDYTTVLGFDPRNIDCYQKRALAYFRQGEYNHAVEDYTAAIGLNLSDANSYYNRGVAYFLQDKYNHACKDYTTAIGLNPNIWNYYYARASVYFQEDKLGLALEDYTAAIKLQPESGPLYRDRGTLYLIEGGEDLAISDYIQWIRRNPHEDIDVLLNRLGRYTRECGIDLPEHIKTRLRESSTNP